MADLGAVGDGGGGQHTGSPFLTESTAPGCDVGQGGAPPLSTVLINAAIGLYRSLHTSDKEWGMCKATVVTWEGKDGTIADGLAGMG